MSHNEKLKRMEEKINVAKILKDKPKGTKLYSDICCGECFLNEVSENAIYVDMYNKERFWYFSVYGTIYAFQENGGVLLYPSYEMRDWRKFAWKKGDVLVSNDGKREVLFKTWVNDSYTKFVGLHCLIINDNEEVEYDKGTTVFNTNDFKGIEAEDDVQTYIKTIEEKLGGKLNRETLEVEKAQPEFKDGDIVHDVHGYNTYIIKEFSNKHIKIYAGLTKQYGALLHKIGISEIFHLRLATEEEKQQLFSALAKEGKAWDAEKKQIVDLKTKVELRPFDRVLVRDSKSDNWRANLFGYIGKDGYCHCVYANWAYCIPYEGNELLLGTSKDVEG